MGKSRVRAMGIADRGYVGKCPVHVQFNIRFLLSNTDHGLELNLGENLIHCDGVPI